MHLRYLVPLETIGSEDEEILANEVMNQHFHRQYQALMTE
jgi:hypothetical protein